MAGQTKTLEQVEDLTAINLMLQSQAQDTDCRQAVSEDNLEGHQVSRTEAGQVKLEEDLNKKDAWLRK